MIKKIFDVCLILSIAIQTFAMKRTASEAMLPEIEAKRIKLDFEAELQQAVEKKDIKTIAKLLYIDSADDIHEILKSATRNHYIEVIKLVLPTYIDVHIQDSDKLIIFKEVFKLAVRFKRSDIIKLLLNAKIDDRFKSQGINILNCILSRQNDQNFIQKLMPVLVNRGANPNLKDKYDELPPLHQAIIYDDHPKIVDLLLQHGANPNSVMQGESALFNAISENNFSIIHSLLEVGADPNKGQEADPDFGIQAISPLEDCLHEANGQIAYLLLMYNAKTDELDDELKKYLHNDLKKYLPRYPKLEKYLVEQIILRNNEDAYILGYTYAVNEDGESYKEPIYFLTNNEELKGRCDTQDAFGMTLLMWAAARGRHKTVQELLKLGSNIFAKNVYGKTALDLAIITKHKDIAKTLYDHMYKNIFGALKEHIGNILPEDMLKKITCMSLPTLPFQLHDLVK